MPQELNGHGPTAGESMGGTGANLNERPDNSTPGGSSHGNAGITTTVMAIPEILQNSGRLTPSKMTWQLKIYWGTC